MKSLNTISKMAFKLINQLVYRLLINPIKRFWKRIYVQNINVICLIWKDKFPQSDPKEHSLLEKILMVPPLLIRTFSFSNAIALFPVGSKYAFWFIDLYVLFWALILTILLNNVTPGMILFAVIAIYRVIDILGYQFCIILIDSQNPNWRLASLRRNFLSSLVNLYEIVVSFSIIYIAVARISHSVNPNMLITEPSSAFYYSLVTMATLGYGEFVPSDVFSRNVVVVQIISELLFLVIFAPVFVANIVNQLGGREFKKFKDADKQKKDVK